MELVSAWNFVGLSTAAQPSDDVKIRVQKAIIVEQCPALAGLINGNELSIADIPDVDSETMLQMLRFLNCEKITNIVNVNMKVLIAADQFGLDDLMKSRCSF